LIFIIFAIVFGAINIVSNVSNRIASGDNLANSNSSKFSKYIRLNQGVIQSIYVFCVTTSCCLNVLSNTLLGKDCSPDFDYSHSMEMCNPFSQAGYFPVTISSFLVIQPLLFAFFLQETRLVVMLTILFEILITLIILTAQVDSTSALYTLLLYIIWVPLMVYEILRQKFMNYTFVKHYFLDNHLKHNRTHPMEEADEEMADIHLNSHKIKALTSSTSHSMNHLLVNIAKDLKTVSILTIFKYIYFILDSFNRILFIAIGIVYGEW
jgi:hypothetical protein